MLDRETKAKIDNTAAMLLRLATELHQAGDRMGALAVSDAADHLMVVLDLDALRARAGA